MGRWDHEADVCEKDHGAVGPRGAGCRPLLTVRGGCEEDEAARVVSHWSAPPAADDAGRQDGTFLEEVLMVVVVLEHHAPVRRPVPVDGPDHVRVGLAELGKVPRLR